MSKLFQLCAAAVCVAAASFAAIDLDFPSAAPAVAGVFPHGIQRGASVEVELSGQNLHDAKSVEFSGKGLSAEILSSLGATLKLRVTADKRAEVGRRDFRLVTARGAYVGVFDVSGLPEIRETEPNDDWRKAQPIQIPVLVNGIIGNEDWDHFRFHADAGQTLVFDVSATRHGSRLDADLAILDDHGAEIAWMDDSTVFGDPHIDHTFEKAGDYIVRVGSLAGGPNMDYRLSIGRVPYVTRTLPAGLGSGQTTPVTISGTYLDLVDELWLGDRAAKGEILNRKSSQLQARFRLPKDFRPGPYRIHASYHGLEIAIPTELRVSNLPETTVARPALTLASALPITPSVVLNGVIEQTKNSHYFRFNAKAGERYLFRAESMKLGYHLDATINLLDSEGKSLAYEDDPGMDDRSDEYQLDPDLSYSFEKSGTYYVAIRDGMYRGGDQMVYRLTVEQMQPDFMVELRDPVKSLYGGQPGTLLVRIRRRAGWNAPVEVWAEDLPSGVTVEHQTAQPKDSVVKDTCGVDRVIDGSLVFLPVRADSSTAGHFNFRIKARGNMGGKLVEHEASVHYFHQAAGYVYGPMEFQRAELTVNATPEVILNFAGKVSLSPGVDKKVEISLLRPNAGNAGPLQIKAGQLPTGVTAEAVAVPAGANKVTLTIKTKPEASSGPMAFQAVDAAGKPVGESAPFLVEIKPAPRAKE